MVRCVTAQGTFIWQIQNGQIDENEIAKVKEKRLVGIEESYKTNGFWMSSISTELTQGVPLLTLEESRARTIAINKAET